MTGHPQDSPDRVNRQVINSDIFNGNSQLLGLLKARLFGQHHGILVFSSICLSVAVLGVFTWLFYYGGYLGVLMDRKGVETEALLSELDMVNKPFVSGWALRYIFQVDGKTCGGVSYFPGDLPPEGFKPGNPVAVEVLPGREIEVNRVKGARLELIPRPFFPVMLIMFAVGLFLAALSGFFAGRSRKILKAGVITRGVICGRSPTVSLRFFGLPPVCFDYRYSDQSGNSFVSKINSYYPEAVLELLPGDEVTVFYNPRRPKKSFMVEALIGKESIQCPFDPIKKRPLETQSK